MDLSPELARVVDEIERAQIPALIARLAARLDKPAPTDTPDRLISRDEVAARLGRSLSWLNHRWRTLPFVVFPGGSKRPSFSERGLEEYLAREQRKNGRRL